MYKVVRLVMRWAPVVGLLVFTGLDMALLLHWVAAGLVLVEAVQAPPEAVRLALVPQAVLAPAWVCLQRLQLSLCLLALGAYCSH
jgi:hypothetical protein